MSAGGKHTFLPGPCGGRIRTFNHGILKGTYHCTVDLFDWFGLVCFANKKQNCPSCDTADSKPAKQEVNGTVILPPLVFPASTLR
jgi:hypothetical protein